MRARLPNRTTRLIHAEALHASHSPSVLPSLEEWAAALAEEEAEYAVPLTVDDDHEFAEVEVAPSFASAPNACPEDAYAASRRR